MITMDSSTKLKRQLLKQHHLQHMSTYEKALIMRSKITKCKAHQLTTVHLDRLINDSSLAIAKTYHRTFIIVDNQYIKLVTFNNESPPINV